MSKKADVNKKALTIPGTKARTIQTNTYQSSRKAQRKFEEGQEHLTVRVPLGSRQKIKDFVEKSDKYSSVNNMIVSLIEREMNTSLKL